MAPDVWDYEVSGLKVVQSWLAYRMKGSSGKKSSPLDDIRPQTWSFSADFVELLSVVEHMVRAEPNAAELLDRVLDGPLIDPSRFQTPTAAERQSPPSRPASGTSDALPLDPD